MEQLLKEIAVTLKNNYRNKKRQTFPISLMGGELGWALFFAYYADFTDDEEYRNLCYEILEKGIDHVSSDAPNVDTFCNGVAGFAWCIQHLTNNKWLEEDEEMSEEFDSFLKDVDHSYLQENNYDFLHGAIGVGLYWLERDQMKDKLAEMVRLLDQLAVKDHQGTRWVNTLPEMLRNKNTEINFGLAHGIPSLIVFLARVYEKGIEQERCSKLISGTIEFMKKYTLQEPKVNYFPRVLEIVEQQYVVDGNNRLAWCYGDLGIAVALLQTAEIFKNQEWKELAIYTARQTLDRKTHDQTLMCDAGLCHGYFGTAHMYQKLFLLCGEQDFLEAANFWYDIGENYLNNYNEVNNYKEWTVTDGWQRTDEFLSGIAGIGMAMINHLQDQPNYSWDRCLLLG